MKGLLVSLVVVFFSFENVLAQNKTYYGKTLNSLITNYKSSNFRPRTQDDYKILKSELFKVLTFTHIEKADQGFDAIVENCEVGKKCYKQSQNEYSSSRSYIYKQLYFQSNKGESFVQDVYCHQKFNFRSENSHNDENGANKGSSIQPVGDINIEHTWPQSLFNKQFSADLQKGDLHHLFPSNGKMNGIRGNYPFGEVERVEESMPNCPSVLGFDKNGNRVFEPVDDHKGNVARAIFYFSIRYQMVIDASQESALRHWHLLDPVDEQEMKKNNDIFAIQHNRNPFIDFPELVNIVSDF